MEMNEREKKKMGKKEKEKRTNKNTHTFRILLTLMPADRSLNEKLAALIIAS